MIKSWALDNIPLESKPLDGGDGAGLLAEDRRDLETNLAGRVFARLRLAVVASAVASADMMERGTLTLTHRIIYTTRRRDHSTAMQDTSLICSDD
jgi:hypothetical protein